MAELTHTKLYLTLINEDKKVERVSIEGAEDICMYADRIIATGQKYDAK